MIEHFSKWLDLVPLLDCSSEGATYAFLDMVVNGFGAPLEILTDQSEEFRGEFQKLCEKALINHHTNFGRSSWGRWVSWMDGVDNEVGFVEIWFLLGPYLRLGLTTTMANWVNAWYGGSF